MQHACEVTLCHDTVQHTSTAHQTPLLAELICAAQGQLSSCSQNCACVCASASMPMHSEAFVVMQAERRSCKRCKHAPELNLDAESDDGPKVVHKGPPLVPVSVPADQDAYSVLRAAMQTHLPWVHERMCAAQDPHAEHVQLMKHAESLLTANSGDAGAVVMMRSKAEQLRNAQDSELRDMVLQDLTMYVTLANSHKTHSKEVARHMHSNDIWMLGADLALLAKLCDLLLKIVEKVCSCRYIESELPS
jgi:hypothetical protein